MGKKKVIQQSDQQILAEKDKLESAISKSVKSSESSTSSKKIDHGKVFINATYNNTIVAVTNKNGDVLAWATAGSLGFSGPKKATPFAATKVIATVAEKLKKTGLQNVDVIVKGIGSGRDSAIRSLMNHGFNILSIKDATPVAHNGPRPPKVRRV